MHTLARNRRAFFYATYQGETPILDAEGRYTGEKKLTYANPKFARMNISPATGNSDLEPFGNNATYSHVLVTDIMDCEIDEQTIIWYGRKPDEKYNYLVVRKAKTLNHVIYALQEVNGPHDANG